MVSGTIVMNGTSPSEVSEPGISTPCSSSSFSRVRPQERGRREAVEMREECVGDCSMYWHLAPNLVVTHGAQIASSAHDEPEQVGRREVLGPWWAHRVVPVRVCKRPRPLHVDMLRSLPSTGVRSSATAHEEADPRRVTHRLSKRVRLPRTMAGSKPSSFLCCWRLIARRRSSARGIPSSSHANQREPSEGQVAAEPSKAHAQVLLRRAIRTRTE